MRNYFWTRSIRVVALLTIMPMLIVAVPAEASPRINDMGFLATASGAATQGVTTAAPQPGEFVGLQPFRVLDTTAVGIPARGSATFALAGHGTIPAAGIGSIMLTLQAVTPASSGYLTVYAASTNRPAASQLNFSTGVTISNSVIAPISDSGAAIIYNSAPNPVRVIVDVSGYYLSGKPSAPGTLTTVPLVRILGTDAGNGSARNIAPKSGITVQVTGRGGVPSSTVADAMINLQTVKPVANGYLTVYAAGSPRPQASNLSFTAGTTVAGLVIAPLSAAGAVTIYNGSSSTVRLIGDLAGYHLGAESVSPGGFAVAPARRVLDTGVSIGPRLGINFSINGQHTGPVALSVQVVSPSDSGYLTVGASDSPPSGTSNITFTAGRNSSNLVITELDSSGGISIYNGSRATIRVILDYNGVHRPPSMSWTASTSLDVSAGKVTGLPVRQLASAPLSIKVEMHGSTTERCGP